MDVTTRCHTVLMTTSADLTDTTSEEGNDKYLTIRLRPGERARLDQVRGSWSLSHYARMALKRAIESDLRGPDAEDSDFS